MEHHLILGAANPPALKNESGHVLVEGELVYPLKVGLNTVGRSFDSDVFLCERQVSRRHCVVLIHTTGTCELHDAGSRNGTFLNDGRFSQPMPLHSGDRIRVWDREFTFLSLHDFKDHSATTLDGDTLHE